MARARLRLGFLPQQRTTFTAKEPVNIVLGPYSIAQRGIFSAGTAKAETYTAGAIKGEAK